MSDDFKERGGSPWGTPPGGGSGNGSGRGPTPPDIDKIIREFQEKIKKFLPGGSSSGGKQAILVLIILGFVWLASGLYRVLPDEQGVVLRFGKFFLLLDFVPVCQHIFNSRLVRQHISKFV